MEYGPDGHVRGKKTDVTGSEVDLLIKCISGWDTSMLNIQIGINDAHALLSILVSQPELLLENGGP